MTVTERRNLVLEYVRQVNAEEWKTPEMSPEVIDAILGEPLVKEFDISQGPYFGQVFKKPGKVRREWIASAALFCWAGKHLISGGQFMYTMAGLMSFPTIPEAWHLEFRPGYGLTDLTTVCRLIPEE